MRVVSPDVAQNSSHIGFIEGMNEGRHGYTGMLWRGVKRGPVRREKGTGGKRREGKGWRREGGKREKEIREAVRKGIGGDNRRG